MSDLPSLDQPQAYVVVGPDDQRGPYTLELLVGEVVAGRLHDATPVWWPGLADWTTMTAHPGLAAEIQRRRAPAAQAAPAATAFAPPAAPPPPQGAPEPAVAAPTEPVVADQGAPGQYEQAGYSQSGGGFPAAAAPGQDYSTEMYAGYGAPAEASVEPSPAEEPTAAVSAVDQPVTEYGSPVEAQDATQLAGENVAADVAAEPDVPSQPAGAGMFSTGVAAGAAVGEPEVVISDTGDAMVVEPIELTAADFEAVDQPAEGDEGFRAAGDAMGLDPGHGAAFTDLIARSRARAEAGAVVANIDESFVLALVGAASAQGLEPAGREDGDDAHQLSFRTAAGDTWDVSLGRVTGSEVAVRDSDIPLEATCTSTTYGGGAVATTGEHGEVVVTAGEYAGSATARVSLLLPLADYVGADHQVDAGALERDLQSVIAVVRDRLRG